LINNIDAYIKVTHVSPTV